jgi:hypothetical protein
MALVSRWDIRTESYSNGNSVTSLTDRGTAGATLASVAGSTVPTYNSTETAMSFNGAMAIGVSGNSTLQTLASGSAWSIFSLVKQSTVAEGAVAAFGNTGNGGYRIQTGIDGTPGKSQGIVRVNNGADEEAVSSGTISAATWSVIHVCYDGTNIKAGIGGAGIGSVTRTVDLAGSTWDIFALGVWPRPGWLLWYTGFLRETRVYNTDETSNIASIISAMTGAGSSVAPLAANYYYMGAQ